MSRLSAGARLPLIQGRQGRYYIVDGFKYDEHFPQEWATNHLSIPSFNDDSIIASGPKACNNCRTYGTVNDVFVGYCGNCVAYIYNDKSRGGFDCCVDIKNDITEETLWCEYKYMNGVKFNEIGDSDDTFNEHDVSVNEQGDKYEDIEYATMQKYEQRIKQRALQNRNITENKMKC